MTGQIENLKINLMIHIYLLRIKIGFVLGKNPNHCQLKSYITGYVTQSMFSPSKAGKIKDSRIYPKIEIDQSRI